MERLPPLNGLRAFEAAARHLSFSRAAEELFVTPAAISHQIKGLEDYLGVTLFRRMPRAVMLTDDAQLILPLVSEGFDKLAQAATLLKESESSGVLTVSSAPTFAQKWLLEHLEDFTDAYPDINVRLDARLDTVDFDRDGVDVAIRLGAGKYPGMRVHQLFDEQVTPVCHPKYLDGPHALKSPEDLRHHTLLHVDWGNINAPFPDWQMWLASVGVEDVDYTRGPVFTVEGMAIDAAARGTGVALASTYAVADDIKAGRLMAPFDRRLTSEISYWVVAPERSADQPKVKAFREWIVRRAKETGLTGG
ncbi:transcriptional regulator GcvA [Thalassospiraceae bacterium LMO-JJ14]|nr:transcriptional regulator GcvA [Thalassospiraceae bacterium LMO-JJ14]